MYAPYFKHVACSLLFSLRMLFEMLSIALKCSIIDKYVKFFVIISGSRIYAHVLQLFSFTNNN